METNEILNSIGLILLAAMLAQWIAWTIRVPAIVLLILFGLLIGPIFHLVDPHAICGPLFYVIIEFAVVILLFEGGLNLRLNDLKTISFGVKRLITLGVLINGIITTYAAHYIAGLSWQISAIIGSILVVTGPTVIIPALRQANLPKKLNQYFMKPVVDVLSIVVSALIQ